MENTIAFLFLIGQLAILFLSGYLAWQWVQPESFGGAVVFLILWGIIETVGYHLVAFAFYGLVGLLDENRRK